MSLLRTDKEVALNDLLVAARETADHYQAAAEYLNDPQVNPVLHEIIHERLGFIERIEHAIRAMGDLPSAPDPDRETGEMLIHHVTAALSPDSATEILEQRIKAEQHLLELVEACYAVGLDDEHAAMLKKMEQQINAAVIRLESMES